MPVRNLIDVSRRGCSELGEITSPRRSSVSTNASSAFLVLRRSISSTRRPARRARSRWLMARPCLLEAPRLSGSDSHPRPHRVSWEGRGVLRSRPRCAAPIHRTCRCHFRHRGGDSLQCSTCRKTRRRRGRRGRCECRHVHVRIASRRAGGSRLSRDSICALVRWKTTQCRSRTRTSSCRIRGHRSGGRLARRPPAISKRASGEHRLRHPPLRGAISRLQIRDSQSCR